MRTGQRSEVLMTTTLDEDTRRAVAKWLFQSAMGVIGYGALIFLSAGTIAWLWGWVLLVVITLFLVGQVVVLYPDKLDLLVERQKGLRDEGVKRWDRWIAAFAAGVFPIISWIVAGLDMRWGWTKGLPLLVHLFALVIMLLGFGIFLWAMRSNAFFSEGVRIQSERGHQVATQGPYRHIRHPGYSGAILGVFAAPLLLGSLWALIPATIAACLYVVRTFLEDRTLQDELPGYQAYCRTTRYRLFPGMW